MPKSTNIRKSKLLARDNEESIIREKDIEKYENFAPGLKIYILGELTEKYNHLVYFSKKNLILFQTKAKFYF